MTAFKSDFLNILQERGFIHQCSDFDGLDALAAKGQATAYVGYDCTAPSLHIGNYLTMMMLHWLQQSGNKPITLMGGGTTMVGATDRFAWEKQHETKRRGDVAGECGAKREDAGAGQNRPG